MNHVTVFRSRHLKGWNGKREHLDQVGAPGQPMALEDALTTQFDSDAHFAQYVCPGEQCCPRLNKPSLAFFETQALGTLPEIRVVAADVDFPEHSSGAPGWDEKGSWPANFQSWWEQCRDAHETTPELKQAGFYATRGGFRYVWPLDEPISAKKAESFIEQLHEYLADQGLPLDILPEWNRLYRLPQVVRDNKRQDWPMDLSSMEPLDWSPPDGLTEVSVAQQGEADRHQMPDPETLSSPNKSDLRPILDEYDFAWLLYKGKPLADPGDRHNTLKTTIGVIVDEYDTTDPIVPFELVSASVEAMIAQGDRRDDFGWSEVWDICHWTCQVHDGHQQATEEQTQSLIERTAEAMDCQPEQVRSRLILASKSESKYYVWDEEHERYEKPAANQSQLLSLLDNHCPRLAALAHREGATGVPKLLRDYSTPVDEIALSYEADETVYEAQSRRVVQSVLTRDPSLEPSFHEDVHTWLKHLFGDRQQEGLDWLATFLDFDRPTCALYIHGPRDIGKSGLLAAGLSRLWRTAPVDYADLLSNFQGSLRTSPLVLADEQVPEDPFQEKGSSVFRRIVGTGRFKLNIKNEQKGTDLIGCPRVLITANNADALRIREALNQQDIRAIQQRIGYIKTDASARKYLDEAYRQQDFDARQDMTQEWVAGGKIAEHLLWLNANREVDIGDRFLVEGWRSELTADIALKFGSVPALGRYLCRVVRDQQTLPGIRYGDGQLKVNFDRVRESWHDVMGRSSQPPTDNDLIEALKVLSEGEKERLRPTEDDNPRYYWIVDEDKIAKIAEDQHVTDSKTIRKVIRSDSQTSPKGRPLHEVTDVDSGSA